MNDEALDLLIGLRLAVGLPGTEATTAVIDQLRQTQAQSLVIFRRNLTSPEQLITLIHDLEVALDRRFLIMVDHEGGRVVRFHGTPSITHFPDALTIGRTQVPAQVETQGQTEASELRRLGIHVNLAPCVDVLVEGSDAVIGDRSYGSDPDHVSQFAIARIRGLQSHDVAACAKHFPGLGAVPRDPHQLLPTISLDWRAMEEIHLLPFEAAIRAGVATIMSSHVCYPGLGDPPGLPATFSTKLIQGLLRDRLRFPGVILSDALEMGALQAFGTIGASAVRAAEAGHDMLLICCPELAAAQEALSSLRNAYRSGRLDTAELEASTERIAQLRKNYLR